MDEDAAEATQSFTANADICQQLLTRYSRSSAAQHRHLCATAAATRSIIQSSSLPLTPISYFAATITSLSNSKMLDSNALGALTSFLSIVLPLVGGGEIKPEKAGEAVRVLVRTVEENAGCLGTSGVRAVVKCVGVLVAEFCDLKEWDSVAFGFEWLVKFSLDKRPKVRKCAQDCLLTVFKLFKSSGIFKKASKSIYLLLKDHMPLAIEMTTSGIVDGSKNQAMPISRPEHQEVLHLLNVIKHVVPHLSPKVRMRMLSQLLKILSSQFSALTRHVFDVISAIFETSGTEVITSNAEDIFRSLVSFISSEEKNPVDSVLLAATLAKTVLGKLHDGDINEWSTYFPMLMESLAGLLSSEADVALQASSMLRELINHHIDGKSLLNTENQDMEDKATNNAEIKAVETTCTTFYNLLSASSQIPSEHFFSVVAFLFLKLGEVSAIFMKHILLKLGDLMNATSASGSETKHLQDCIGSAVAAMGPEKLLGLLPICLSTKNYSCSNIWLMPILKENIVGSSLRFFMEHIVPLAESFEKGSRKELKRSDLHIEISKGFAFSHIQCIVTHDYCEDGEILSLIFHLMHSLTQSRPDFNIKNSVIGQDLQAYAHGCWDLLPAFCRHPTDTYQSFGALTQLLIRFLKKESFMLENIAIGLQELVNENKNALASGQGSVQLIEVRSNEMLNEFATDLNTRRLYSKKIASKNLKALASSSKELLQALTNVLFESPSETRKHLKGAIRCLVSVCDASVTKEIFIDSLEKFQLLDDIGEHGNNDGSADEKEGGGTDAKRSLILDLASCVVEGSDNDMVNLLFAVTRRALQVSDEVAQMEAYQTLSRILEKHSWFCSSQFAVVVDLLNAVKSSANITLLKGHFSCLQTLLIHALMRNVDEENTDAFLILNEIILTLKDSNEEGRKVAYDALHGISSKLRSSSDASYDGLYHKLLTIVEDLCSIYLSQLDWIFICDKPYYRLSFWFLSHIKSGVVSALSVLIYNDPDIGLMVPDVVPSVMELLHSKAVEVIKAVLGFVKVLVSCLKPNDLQHFLPNIMDGIIRWSSVSRHHFKTKVIVILEIMMRKCGSAAVKALAPEKYKDFVHGVVVNRHGKTNSKEGGNNDARPELSDASLKGQQKRKRDESTISAKEEGSARTWKRQRDKKQNAGKPVGRGKHSSHYGDLQKGKLDKNRGSEVRDFKTKLSGGKKHGKRILTNRKDEGKIHKPAVASKSLKRKREVRKDRKSAAQRT
ncbi:UNVERIFIED_CONTAM: RRP12-like protein [Sesamum latifolium]|uniref:RRP12-like protein n=1 Tax=Sesamum latifolium TaxID=2727402 RepID=A0AAW2XGI1_9LAMI